MARRLITLGLIGCIGCAGGPASVLRRPNPAPVAAPTGNYVVSDTAASIEKSNDEILLVNSTASIAKLTTAAHTQTADPSSQTVADLIATETVQSPDLQAPTVQPPVPIEQPIEPAPGAINLNLPSALAMVGGQHPAVGQAQWRVQEAYAQLESAQALWLPSIGAGFSFDRHDGNYQASDGDIVDVNRNSFQYGLGSGAVGAGTTPRPGLVAQFHLADAIFLPRRAQKTAWAAGHAASATVNRQMLQAALAYLDLLDAHQNLRVLEESQARAMELSKVTRDFAEAGQGLLADADRMQTEVTLTENRLLAAREQISVASARLAQAVSLNSRDEIVPTDITVLPLELSSTTDDPATLIGTGLAMRPELKESQALVAAACDAYEREKYAPFVPSILLGFSTGGFGGGLGNNLDNIDSRYDLDALMSWEIRNLGVGEQAARRASSARVQQAKFETVRMMDQVAREVSEACVQVRFRRQQIDVTRRAIESAQGSYDRNFKRIRDGEGLPLEVLQSVQALESAQQAYRQAVVDFNQSQFRLQWAQGWPVEAAE
ncbi:TolC family protein [Stieleria sp. TO1_6]|uniref:TolC family protein n=1 Tax=Stieleria tagensis TaxID=2956795 RepID=UPI00209B08F4|nr:TolC family protein [Stieleria tagensis]MCO8121357.1 TolC family protein [Stieleria tagensis]